MLHDVTLQLFNPVLRRLETVVVVVDADNGNDAASKGHLEGARLQPGQVCRVVGIAPSETQPPPVSDVTAEVEGFEAEPKRGPGRPRRVAEHA